MTRRYVAVVVALLALLAACDDDPEPRITEPTPSSSNPTVSDSVTPTEPTETAEPLSPEKTVRAWFMAWSQALVSGDTAEVEALSDDKCGSCSRLIAQLQSIYERGGYLKTAGWRPLTNVVAPDSSDATPRFLLRIAETERTLFDADGKTVDVSPRKEVPMRMTLGGGVGSWRVTRLEILK